MLKHLLRSITLRPRAVPSASSGAPAKHSAAGLNEEGLGAWHRGDLQAAEHALRAAAAADPGFAAAHGNLGMVLWEQRRLDEALATLRRGVAADPGHVGVRINLANALAIANVHQEALAQYREALRLAPGHPLATANVLRPMLDVCEWDASERLLADLVDRWRADPEGPAGVSIAPFMALLVEVPQAMRLAVARRYSHQVVREASGLRRPIRAPRRPGARLRIGYASADFHDHATAHLATGLFEHHDRARFEVHAYSFGIDDGSAHRRRLVAAFEHFHDVRTLGHEALAERIAADRIDILVDLKGYTGEARPHLFALRPAPLQIAWLGYPGTMAAPFIDAIVADAVVVPHGAEDGYGEEVLRLPHCYQANDDRQAIAERTPTRAELGLPPTGFVFVCFNEQFKIDRVVFARWMAILRAVPGSVLWLLGGHGDEALRGRAADLGVDPARLVFAPRLPKREHLARHRVGDLFLDTRTCNAHTTASDALWAGLPLLACAGDAFAGRVSSSLLCAVGMPALIAPDLDAYERTAVALARSAEGTAAMRAQLAATRLQQPLFRTERFTRELEGLYLDLAARLPA